MAGLRKNQEIGPYVVDGLLAQGKGGMAQVCEAHEKLCPDIKVAIKIARVDNGCEESNISILRGEAEVLRMLIHPNIVKILPLPLNRKIEHYMARAIELPGMPWYYTMELLQGRSLAELIKENKSGLPETQVILLGLKIAGVLDHMHGLPKPLAYLDLKPENIVYRFPLNGNDPVEPVLIDFGSVSGLKTPQLDRLTVIFAPWERLQQMEPGKPGNTQVDLTKVDIYSLGVVLYEALTGRFPFMGNTQKAIITAISNHAVVPIQTARPGNKFSPELTRLIEKMMCFHPLDRPSAAEVVRALTQFESPIRLNREG